MKMNKTVRPPKVLKKGEVLTTKNYDLFKFLSCNRDISQANYKKLLQSLGKRNVYGASTILVKQSVDGYYYIHEGQHRYMALKELGQPIDFIINPELIEDDISLMNTASEVWHLPDFLKRYLDKGENESYNYINRLVKDYVTGLDGESVRAMNFSDILYISTGWTKGVQKDFKNGTLKVTEEQYNKARTNCELLKGFLKEGVLPLSINVRRYIQAILDITTEVNGWEEVDTLTLKNKIESYRIILDYQNYGRRDMYKKLFVEVYNKGQKKRFIGVTSIGKDVEYFIVNKK
jgi:hypothetical protein